MMTLGVATTIAGGIVAAEDRYANASRVAASLSEQKASGIATSKALVEYTRLTNFYRYRLASDLRWVDMDLSEANGELEVLKSNSATLTANQRVYARTLEQKIGRLLKLQESIDTQLQELELL